MRLLGLDYGSARIGVALGDTETRLASPWRVIAAKDQAKALVELELLAREEGIDGFVIGIPRPLADQSRITDQAQTIRAFAEKLQARGWKTFEENETLSSAQAASMMQERQERGKRDDLAATVILQSYLDRG